MSARSKHRKHAKKRSWKKKMLKLHLEQANGKPDPPFVYNGKPNFTLYQKWVLEAKDWLKLSFIQRKHCVARLKKYLASQAFHFFSCAMSHMIPKGGHSPIFWKNCSTIVFPPISRQFNVRSVWRSHSVATI
jgi:hypothetical protein